MNPPDRKPFATTPDDWLLHARSDLKISQVARNQGVLKEQICFHAQQAVEKAFKSVLLFNKIDFPFTHDLEELLTTFYNSGISVPTDLVEVGALTPYAVETRYPGCWEEISDDDLNEALTLA